MRTISRTLSVSAAALLLAACQLTPPPTALQSADVPAGFTAPVVDKNAPTWPAADWWGTFNAPELPGLIQTAMRENLDLRVSSGRVLEAEANGTIALAALMPTVSGNPLLGASKSGTSSTDADRFSAGISGSYVLDFFGQNRARLAQAEQNLRAARYAQAVVGLTVQSSVAQAYFNILALRERIAITRQNLDLSQQLLAISQAKFAAGVASNLDVQQEIAQVAGQQSRLPGLIEQEREARYGLAILLGKPPEDIEIQGQNLDGLNAPNIQPGTPSDLLLRRPDIAQAEASLFASHANVDAARATYFPQIGISAGVSWSSSVIGTLFDPASFAWNLGASLAQTIFDGGRINANNQIARAQQEEQIATYRSTVFKAFQNVEAAVGNADAVTQQLSFVTTQERASVEAQRISSLQYREGTIDVTSLLVAQQSQFNAQDTLIQTKLARLNASLALYIAMGGGWEQKASDADYKPQLDWFPL
jgi:NodT family efflux transporter outer membrane factor (OMF) lipoprotein